MLELIVLLATAYQPVPRTIPIAVQQLSNTQGIDVVVVAHADDWQVFMGDAVMDRVRSGRRPAFIYLTAGDHGRGPPYWRQREEAALESTRILLGAFSPSRPACDTVHVRGHGIYRCQLGSSVSYFFRLPDGNRGGSGFARTHFESLRKLRSKGIALHAIDSTATYSNWQDLGATLTALVRMIADSTSSEPQIVIHTTDPSMRANPHDHYDHRMAGKLVESLLRANGWSGRYYVGYALATRAPNRTNSQRQEKLAVFSAYEHAMMRVDPSWSAYGEHPAFYSECMERTYARSVSGGSPAMHH